MGRHCRLHSGRLLHPELGVICRSGAELAAETKSAEYSDLSASYILQSIALETHGPIDETAMRFLGDMGHKLAVVSNEDREIVNFFQRLSICLQWFNVVLLHVGFPESDASDL